MPLTLSQREDLNPMNFRCSSFLGQISEKAFTGSDPTLHSRLANILVHKIHRGKDDLGLSVNQPIVQHLTSDGNIRQRVQKAPQDSRRVLEYYVKVVSNSDDKVAEHWIPFGECCSIKFVLKEAISNSCLDCQEPGKSSSSLPPGFCIVNGTFFQLLPWWHSGQCPGLPISGSLVRGLTLSSCCFLGQ